jgi:hypothetical protein
MIDKALRSNFEPGTPVKGAKMWSVIGIRSGKFCGCT